MPGPDTTICRLADVADVGELVAQMDRIFFEASGASIFEIAARAGFRYRWLGRYLAHFPEQTVIALGADAQVLGYLVGCLDDPACHRHFADVSYFADFARLTARYPAHLHINLAPAFRSRGIGAKLIETFVAQATAAGAPGIHVVTIEGARNIAFYLRCGFEPAGSTLWDGKRLVFLGRGLAEHGRTPSR